MRVAIDVTPLVGHRTGIGQALEEITATLPTLNDAPELVPYALSLRARRHRATLPPNTRFLPIPARVLLRTWGRVDWPRPDRWLRGADVVHATNYLAPPSQRPTVVSVYDCSFLHFPESCSPDVRRFEPVIRRAARRGAWIHTSSEFVANEIREFFGHDLVDASRVVVVPLGVPPLHITSPAASAIPLESPTPFDGRYVLAIGTLDPRKNLDHLVRAFSAIAETVPDLRLVLAGTDGLGRPAIDAELAALPQHIAARVVLTGPVDDEQRVALLTHASVLAYPSLYEGFGFPILEGMASGVPVVASTAGSIPEVAGDAALLVDPHDDNGLSAALSSVLGDDETRRDLVAAGRARAATYTWKATAYGLNALYHLAAATTSQ